MSVPGLLKQEKEIYAKLMNLISIMHVMSPRIQHKKSDNPLPPPDTDFISCDGLMIKIHCMLSIMN